MFRYELVGIHYIYRIFHELSFYINFYDTRLGKVTKLAFKVYIMITISVQLSCDL